MLFNSYIFIVGFLPLTLALFFVAARRSNDLAVQWLVAASVFFYGWWDWRFVPLLGMSIIFNFMIGLAITRARLHGRMHAAHVWLVFGIAADLALLGWFKYLGFFIAIFSTDGRGAETILPLGISFFTFTQLAYLVDASRGEAREHDFARYCLFVTFFPHLIAGPILHHSEMLPQFSRSVPFRPNTDMMAAGMGLFAIGLVKKLGFADAVAPTANAVFSAANDGIGLTFAEAWTGAFAYALQIYFDFSGYSDMALGLAAMFGIRMPLNFSSPYKARSIIDFWRCWHITLSRLLRNYLYIPLGGSRCGSWRRYLNLMLTMLLGGLWHGAGWTFILWGCLHGIYLVVNHAWRRIAGSGRSGQGRAGWLKRFVSTAMTFLAVVVAWVLFRAESLPAAVLMLKAMSGSSGIALPAGMDAGAPEFLVPLARQIGFTFTGMFGNGILDWRVTLPLIGFLLGIVFLAPNSQQIFASVRPYLDPMPAPSARTAAFLLWRPSLGFGLIFGALLMVGVLSISRDSPFLYYQF